MRNAMLLGLLLLLGFGGCSCSDEPTIRPLSEGELASIPAVTPTELKALLDAQKGKLVVLAIWSVRREACLAMYPKLNALLQTHGAAETVVVAVNVDRVDDVRNKVLPMIREHEPKFLNRVARGGSDPLASFVDENWHGQVPAIVLYGRDGAKVAAFYGAAPLAKAKKRLAEL